MGVASLEGAMVVVVKGSGSVVMLGRIVLVIAAWVWEWEELGREV